MDALRKTNVSPRKLKAVKVLHSDGVGVREIARRVKLSPTTVCGILNLPLTATHRCRCATCGALIEGEVCRRCELMKELEDEPDLGNNDEADDSEDDEIKLELRPAELARYWQVRPLAEARYDKMAEYREALEIKKNNK